MKLSDVLTDIGVRANRISGYVNQGGCCVFASIVAQELESIQVPVSGVAAHWSAGWAKPIYLIRRKVSKIGVCHPDAWQSYGVNFGHVALELKIGRKVYHYDSNGLERPNGRLMEMPIYPGRLRVSEMVELASTGNGWNSSFNRADIPKLEKLVWASFKRITSLD